MELPSPSPESLRTRRNPATPSSVSVWLLLLGTALACDQEPESAPAPERTQAAAIPEPAFPIVGDSAILGGPSEDWPTVGGNAAHQRYSPLTQIDPGNVQELVPAWIHSTGIEGAFETTPVVVGNTMYVTTARGRVVALNASTGRELWTYDPSPAMVTLCCGPSNSGVSAYGNAVYVSSLDARLIALNARTGRPIWERRLADPAAGYSATMAPLAVDGLVYVGVAGERYGIRGFVAAFDAASGEERWRWQTIPEDSIGWWGEWRVEDPFGTPLNRDIPSERADSFETRFGWTVGGGGVATTPAYDGEAGRLFVNVEGPAPVVHGAIRPGDNLYTGSIVALDARTGERIWHTQYLPHDVWGLSGGSPPFLFERGDRLYVGFAGRTGWAYVFDAENGRPILRTDNFVPQENLFTPPPDTGGVRVAPGANGGNAGGAVAYDPRTGIVFVGGVHQPMVYRSRPEGYGRGRLWLGGDIRFAPGEAHWGTVSALDLGDGSMVWQRQTPEPVHSGLLATASGLVFVGQGSGTFDAFDARSGELLWQFDLGAGVHGGPVTYSVAGVQYVVVPAGGSFHFGTPGGDDLVAFALASRRPATTTTAYPAPEYERSGPATAIRGRVRQLAADSLTPAPGPAAAVDSTPGQR